MTRHIDDAALMMATLSKPDWRDATSLPYETLDWNIPAANVKGLKLGLMLDAGCWMLDVDIRRMRQSTAAALHEVDAILSPVNPHADFPVEWCGPTNDPLRPFEHICFTVPWNMGEQPACSVHCGFAPSGVPIGLQIVAPRFHDLRVFALGRAFESWQTPITNWPHLGAYKACVG